jgi:rhodanese-related sulfurtransferase
MKDVDSLLADARSTITRLSAEQAHAAVQEGALLVDARSGDEQREQGYAIPGSVHHPLSVVFWRLDELPREARVIVICRHGFVSRLAAARLQELGFAKAADVIGGAEAWQAAGLPVDPV